MRALCCATLCSLAVLLPGPSCLAATVEDWVALAESSSPVLAAEDARL